MPIENDSMSIATGPAETCVILQSRLQQEITLAANFCINLRAKVSIYEYEYEW